MVVSVTEDYIKTSQWCVSTWCELLESGNISTNWRVSIILLFPATHCWVYRCGIHFIQRKDGHNYTLIVKRNAKLCAHHVQCISYSHWCERRESFVVIAFEAIAEVEECRERIVIGTHQLLYYWWFKINSSADFDTYRGWCEGLCLWFTRIGSGSRRLNLGGRGRANVLPIFLPKKSFFFFFGYWVE